jgi:1,5-anhydro-D-fructose reductase (1,5-anhydro-D-mannitol-forming)
MKITWGLLSTADIAGTAFAPAAAAAGHAIAAVAGREPGRTRAFAERHGIARACARVDDLLALDEVDAVYVAGPNALHADAVCAAAAAGKHVLCEKPLATTVEDARRAVDACHAAGVRLGVNFQARFTDAARAARDAVTSGRLGELRLVEFDVAWPGGPPEGWRADPALAGLGATNDLGTHAFDMIRFVCGDEVAAVTAELDSDLTERPEAIALVLLRLRGGALVRVTIDEQAVEQAGRLRIRGTAGHLEGHRLTPPAGEPATLRVAVAGEPETTLEAPTTTAFQAAVTAFAQAVAEDRDPDPGAVDGVRSVELVAAVAASARDAATVTLARG